MMLPKEKNNRKIHRLRVIHLYEADYNLILGVNWREALHYAEDNHLLNPSMYGSRPGRSTHEPILLEVLQNKIYWTSRKRGIHQDNDAASCYDCVLAAVASLASQKYGIDPAVALVNASTLEGSQLKLKTSLGTSSNYYCHEPLAPIHGTGQGTGNSPTIWWFVCLTLFDAHQAKACGATFESYDKTTAMKLHIFGFVDNRNQRVNLFSSYPQPSSSTLLQMIQHDTKQWSNLLWSSGGKLEITKCSYYIIQTEYTSSSLPILANTTPSHPLIIQGPSTNTFLSMKYLPPHQSHKTLGYWLNPAGSMKTQFTITKLKSNLLADVVSQSTLSLSEVWMFYFAIYLPGVGYVLPISAFSELECHNIQRQFIAAALPNADSINTVINHGSSVRKLMEGWVFATSTRNKGFSKS